MGNNALKQRLGRRSPVAVNDAHRARTAALAREAFASRRPYARMGFLAFCFRQVGFCGRQTWWMQAALLLCLSLGLRLSYTAAIWPFTCSVPFVLRVSAIVIALTALPVLYRSAQYRMLEVEISARAGYARLLLSRLALTGMGDALMLSGMLALAVLYTDIGLMNALLCLLLPFLATMAAFLLLLRRIPIRALPHALFAIGMAMLIVIAALGAELPGPRLYPAWGALAAALAVLCATQLAALRRQGGFADAQFS